MRLRPNLLFVSPRFLFPVDSGGKIRTTQILRGLNGGAFAVTLASPAPRGGAQRHAAELAQVCDRFTSWTEPARGPWYRFTRMSALLSRLPIPVAADRSRRGSRIVRAELARAPQVVVFDFPHAAVLAPRTIDVPSVLFTHNVEAEIFRRHRQVARSAHMRWLWGDQHRKMVAFERHCLRRFDRVIAVAERDRDAFQRDYGIGGVEVIPTGVDLDYFDYCGPAQHGPGGQAEVVFCGSMDWLANVDAVEFFLGEVWPRVVAEVPEAQMTVVGRDPPSHLQERAKAAGVAWRFTGFVDDVRPHVRRAAAFVVPLRIGGGTRLKVFEAMATGCPVVSTSIGVEGLPLVDGEHFLCADDAATFAAAVVRLLRDAELRVRLARRARAHVEASFSFRAAAAHFERICVMAAASGQRTLQGSVSMTRVT